MSYATNFSMEDESQKCYFEWECGSYAFLVFWCGAGSSLMHHIGLCTAGIVDPGLLTLAKIPHISKFSCIS